MEWQSNNGIYVLRRGGYTAEVWQIKNGTWVGRIGTTDIKAQAMTVFQGLEDAQAWCLSELSKLHHGDEATAEMSQ